MQHDRRYIYIVLAEPASANTSSHTRYFHQFLVSDITHRQHEVAANVTVYVTTLSDDVIPWAVPVTITSHNARQLVKRGKVGILREDNNSC